MTPRLVIFGCGYVGEAVARLALNAGWSVEALVRRPERAVELRAGGVQAVAGDLAGGDWAGAIAPGAEAALVAVSAGGGGVAGYRATYVDGLARVRHWASGGPIGSLIYTSSTGVYPQGDGARVDESSPRHAPGGATAGSALVEAEAEVERGVADGAWVTGVVLRLAGIYGPGRHHLLDQLRRGETTLAGSGTHRLNLIHRDDAARAVLAVLASPPPGYHTYNLADGQPAPKAEVMAWLAARLGLPSPTFSPEAPSARTAARGGPVPDRLIVADALRAATGWQPRYTDYRQGYDHILGDGK